MTPEEKVLVEIKESIGRAMLKLQEIADRKKELANEKAVFEEEKGKYQLLIVDYKEHKKALEDRIKIWNTQHP